MESITTTIFNNYLANQHDRSYSKLGQARESTSRIAAANFLQATCRSSYPTDSVGAHYTLLRMWENEHYAYTNIIYSL